MVSSEKRKNIFDFICNLIGYEKQLYYNKA